MYLLAAVLCAYLPIQYVFKSDIQLLKYQKIQKRYKKYLGTDNKC